MELYLIEVSKNGNEFEPVQKILPEINDGSQINYKVWIEDLNGSEFIRIKGKEWDGEVSYSKTIRIHN